MLHLQPGVHLEEVERALGVEQELDRAGVAVADQAGDGHGRAGEASPHLGLDCQRRALLDHLLVAALDRALALDARYHRAVVIAEQLHLDVARSEQSPLEVDGRIAERRCGLGSRRAQGAGQFIRLRHRPHALAAAAGHGLQDQRVADAVGEASDLGLGHVVADRRLGAGHHRHAGGGRRLAGRGLAAHELDGFGRGADEGQAGVTTGPGEVCVLGEEAVARVHGVGAAPLRDVDERIDLQVALARRVGPDRPRLVGKPDVQRRAIAFAVDGDSGDAHVAAGADDAHGDLAAIRDQDPWKRSQVSEKSSTCGARRARVSGWDEVAGSAGAVRAGCCRASSAGSGRAWSRAWPAPGSAAGVSCAAG